MELHASLMGHDYMHLYTCIYASISPCTSSHQPKQMAPAHWTILCWRPTQVVLSIPEHADHQNRRHIDCWLLDHPFHVPFHISFHISFHSIILFRPLNKDSQPYTFKSRLDPRIMSDTLRPSLASLTSCLTRPCIVKICSFCISFYWCKGGIYMHV